MSVQSILKDNLNTHKIATIFMPCLLSVEQKENYVIMCWDFQERLEKDLEFFFEIMTCDDIQVLGTTKGSKQQSSWLGSLSCPFQK